MAHAPKFFARLRFYRSSSGWRWTLRARNGRIIAASSEAFTRKTAAKSNVALIWVGLEDELLRADSEAGP